MSGIQNRFNEKGSVMLLSLVVLVAVSALGVTMISLSKNQIDMSTNLKVKEIARFNCDSCLVTVGKLIRHVVDQSMDGNLGIAEGSSMAPGIVYATATTSAPSSEEFARKVLFKLETDGCEDVFLDRQAIANAVNAASNGAITIDPAVELDSAADLRTDLGAFGTGASGHSAALEFAAGHQEGLGLGGPLGGGMVLTAVYTCRGRAPANALHMSYSVYRKPLGIGGK